MMTDALTLSSTSSSWAARIILTRASSTRSRIAVWQMEPTLGLVCNIFAGARLSPCTDVDHTCYTISNAGEDGFLQVLPVYLDHVRHENISLSLGTHALAGSLPHAHRVGLPHRGSRQRSDECFPMR